MENDMEKTWIPYNEEPNGQEMENDMETAGI